MNIFIPKTEKNPYKNFPKLPKGMTWKMHPSAVKCSRCEEGYRHPVGNCVLCDGGPSPYIDEKAPRKNDRVGRFMALGKLNMQLLSTEEASFAVFKSGPLLDYAIKPGDTLVLTKFSYGCQFTRSPPNLKVVKND